MPAPLQKKQVGVEDIGEIFEGMSRVSGVAQDDLVNPPDPELWGSLLMNGTNMFGPPCTTWSWCRRGGTYGTVCFVYRGLSSVFAH